MGAQRGEYPIATFWVDHRFPSTNEYISECRKSAYAGHTMKRTLDEIVAWSCKSQGIKQVRVPVVVCIRYFEPNRRRDLDNIYFASKFILDGMVKAGVLADDNQQHVKDVKSYYTIRPGENASVKVMLYACPEDPGKPPMRKGASHR